MRFVRSHPYAGVAEKVHFTPSGPSIKRIE